MWCAMRLSWWVRKRAVRHECLFVGVRICVPGRVKAYQYNKVCRGMSVAVWVHQCATRHVAESCGIMHVCCCMSVIMWVHAYVLWHECTIVRVHR
jgi:hypothetical protein